VYNLHNYSYYTSNCPFKDDSRLTNAQTSTEITTNNGSGKTSDY